MIKRVLRNLGITANYAGYQQTAVAIQLILEDESRLRALQREVYPAVAQKCGSSVSCVERNIRTISCRAWEADKQRLIKVAGFQLTAPPSNSQFLAILAEYIRLIEK